jgi:hypothetical protein
MKIKVKAVKKLYMIINLEINKCRLKSVKDFASILAMAYRRKTALLLKIQKYCFCNKKGGHCPPSNLIASN